MPTGSTIRCLIKVLVSPSKGHDTVWLQYSWLQRIPRQTHQFVDRAGIGGVNRVGECLLSYSSKLTVEHVPGMSTIGTRHQTSERQRILRWSALKHDGRAIARDRLHAE